MIFRETELKGAFIIEPQKFEDERGFFARTWCKREFGEHGLNPAVAQCNTSFNWKEGTLRGMHYQVPPHEEAKFVRCTRGAIFDVIIDMREDSPAFGKWIGVELTGDNHRMLYIPEGFAHGYQTLRDNTEVTYQVSQSYAPGSERGIRWNDPFFQIAWPEARERIISAKDKSWPDYYVRH